MTGIIAWLAGARIGRLLSAVVAGAGVILGAYLLGRREGAQGEAQDALRDGVRRDKEGRNAVAREKQETAGADNRTLVDRLRGRDGDWRGL